MQKIETDQLSLKSILEKTLDLAVDSFDVASLKYVIYARKSTTDETRQERSIIDQVADCTELVKKHGLNVVKVIREAESARESGIRTEFDQMINDLQAGKYQGIITWHPDRLARNMKDAGALMDLLDKKILKDLKFCTFSFENSPMGKMLLGISFVLSKQYTDHLSESVKRGINHSIAEGKWVGKSKHGYFIDANKYLRPDGENWKLIKEAFQMRLNHAGLTNIVDYLNAHRYSKATTPYTPSTSRRPFKFTIQTLSSLFKDPFYAGVAIYGDQLVQMTDVYDFVPVVTEEEWKVISPLETAAPNSQVSRLYRSRHHFIEADLLRRIVVCGYCDRPMSTGITTKKLPNKQKSYRFYYRCESKGCSFEGKSVRAKVVIDFIYSFFEHFIFASEDAYKRHCEEIKTESIDQHREAKAKLKLLKKTLGEKTIRYEQVKTLCAQTPDMLTHFKQELNAFPLDIAAIENEIKEQQELIKKVEDVPVAYEKFLELSKEIAYLIRKTDDISLKDKYIQEVFSNLVIKDKKIANYSLKDPFATWVKEGKFLSGRGSRT